MARDPLEGPVRRSPGGVAALPRSSGRIPRRLPQATRHDGRRNVLKLAAATGLTFGAQAAAAAARAEPGAPPAPASAVPGEATATVTVVGSAPASTVTIDRRAYSIGSDLQQTTGSLADVLRDVPSVQVDTDGNVSLRGDPNVTILVDGKPSAMFSGPARAQAVQAMSAGQFSRVEVLTNPPAGFTAEGSGGVINLISRSSPTSAAARTLRGNLKASVGVGDRYDLGGDGAFDGRSVSATAGFDMRRSGYRRTIGSGFQLPDQSAPGELPASGARSQDDRSQTLTAFGSGILDLSPKDRLGASFNLLSDRTVEQESGRYATATTQGPQALAFDDVTARPGHFTSTSESLSWDHALPRAAGDISVKLETNQARYTVDTRSVDAFSLPATQMRYDGLKVGAQFPDLDLKIDYKVALPGKAELNVGYEGKVGWNRDENQGVTGASAAVAVPDAAQSQVFTSQQRVEAIYGSYDRTVGALEIQPGLRLEETTVRTDLASPAGEIGQQHYFEAYPSLHVAWTIDPASKLEATYGRRAQRPEGGQLDPFRVYNSPTSYSAGNPDLRPAITQSFEFSYDYRHAKDDVQATLFYRDKSNLLTTVVQDIGGDVLLSTWANLGRAHDLGLEFTVSRNLLRTLAVNGSFTLMRSDVDAVNLGIADRRSALIASGQLTAKWTPTALDTVQMNAQASGRQLNAQGYRGGAVFAGIGWRRQIDRRLSFVMTAENPFGLARRTVAIETPTLTQIDKRKFNDCAVFLGLTYAFGAVPSSGSPAVDLKPPGGPSG